jgi:hypothetical protein
VLVSGRSSTKDIKGVGYIAMELMHKESKYDGPMHIRDPHRWPLDSKPVQFVLMTEAAYSIDELLEVEDPLPFVMHLLIGLKHPLMSCQRRSIDIPAIRANVYTAGVAVRRNWEW